MVTGLSAEHGRLDFMIRGARRVGKKQFPAVDLFRELQVEYRDRGQGLPSLYQVELLKAHDKITARPGHYLDACEAAAFLLRNTRPGIASPEVFAAFQHVLTELEQDELMGKIARADLVRLVYLDEHGLFPDHLAAEDEASQEQLQRRLLKTLLEAVQGRKPLPELTDQYWAELSNWIHALCHYHELE